ncbi:hypothetical protein FHS31_001289 [Sphingomonas vulcanisoli]|uniref:Ice-binding protein C-terminal domain-containing protein n=1 Tax=Sphingomonas vulcanisoli TaxID=1658060 RepID=A0ABX0TQ89_9SPHN|nr:PEP-CTERM sorting domain-containing protein [Sphingomonas vulcanisoli]NIJ07693.1 hypothetical protein [Sphingomonas vulcanisoli]
MAVAASLLRSEMRRHLLMNIGLVASCVAGGTVVTNERGLFVPLGIHSMSETAKAFAAMFTPSHLLPGFTNVQMITPLEPFDVTADSRDLRRRLMEDSVGDFSSPSADPDAPVSDLAQYSGPASTLTVTELNENGGKTGGEGKPGGSSGGSDSSGGSSSAPATQTAQSTGQDATTGGASPLNKNTGDLLASNQQTSNSEVNGGDTTGNVTTPVDDGGGVTPVPEPSMWLMMLAGFGATGYILRTARRRRAEAAHEVEAA